MFLPPFGDLAGNDLFKNHQNFFCGVRESSLRSLLQASVLKQRCEGGFLIKQTKLSTAGYIISEWHWKGTFHFTETENNHGLKK